jgi:hypothetical protein
VKDSTFSTDISSSSNALAVEEDELVLLALFFFGTGAVDAYLAPRHVVQRAEARGEGEARVRDAARDSKAW